MSLLFAATYPERVRSLALYASFARVAAGPDYPGGVDRALATAFIDNMQDGWGTGVMLAANASDAPPGDEPLKAAARYERNSSTPGVAAAIMRANVEIDVRHVLPAIAVPTLVLHCAGDPFISVEHGRYLAENIPGARYVELDDDFHVTWRDERYGAVLEAIEEHLTGVGHTHQPDRVLKTVLFTDIVGSTATATQLGDARWKEVLDAHDRAIRRELVRFRGTEVATTGDGFLAAFDGPARAIRCAHAIVEAADAAGVHIRAGLHTGECEVRGADLAGVAVHIGARVAAKAATGEVLVSSTVRDLVAGSGVEFEDQGEHELKGVPGSWRLLRAVPPGGEARSTAR